MDRIMKVTGLVTVVGLTLALLGGMVSAQPLLVPGEDYVPGEVLVKFRPGTPEGTIARVNKLYGTLPAKEVVHRVETGETLPEIAQKYLGDATQYHEIATRNQIPAAGFLIPGQEVKVPSLDKSRIDPLNVYHLEVTEGMDVPGVIQRYKTDPSVEYAEPNYIGRIVLTPNDPHYPDLWAMPKIQAPQAWDIHTGTSSVIVAVIDTGVDYNHPDLAGKVIMGYDYYNDDADPMDDHSHGTHCAGSVAAIGNNSIGVVGVSWGARILAIKWLSSAGYGSTAGAANSIIYAADHGADILSNSWRQPSSSTLEDAVNYAYNNGCLVVSAAGNDYCSSIIYPARYPNSMAIAATDSNDNRASFSNCGPELDVAAPGVSIYSTIPGNSYGYKSGTSMSTPHVAGLAALLKSYNPSLTNDELREYINQSADDLGASGHDNHFGYGRINAYQALLFTPEVADYVIITNEALKNYSGTYNWQALMAQKESRGLTTRLVTTEEIYDNYSGSDNQEKIRNFIKSAYTNGETEYVLLGGYSGIIPPRMFWVQGGGAALSPGTYTTTMPSDMYYACLDGTFNYDGDSRWAEPNDGPGGGEVDLYAEVYVGRAAVANTTELSNFVKKTLAYENSTADYLRTAYMVGEKLDASTWGGDYMEEIRLGSSAHGYTTVGFAASDFFNVSTLYDKNGTWSKSQLITIMNSGVHLLNHLGHASYTYDMKLYTSNLSSLTNTEYFFVYSQGCMPGGFDTSNCFAEVITTMSKGAFAVVMNARYGWYLPGSTNGPSQHYHRQFWDAVLGEHILNLGRANQDSKEDNVYQINGDCMRWCYYELNLFGDPETPINVSVIPGDTTPPRVVITYPADGATVSGTITIKVDASDE